MPATPDRVKSVFFAALEREPAERSTFLGSACGGDDELRRRVEALLQAGEAADPLLDRPAAWHLELPPPTPPEGTPGGPEAGCPDAPGPTQAGRFRLLGEIARGGMGAVLRAHDPEMDRVLAVKVVLPQHKDDPSLTRRFLGEARLAGQLQHPGVVPVHDLGRLPDGRPYFAMKLIEGRTLAQLLRERPDPGHDLPRFLRYFEAVCQAIGYAHSRGVIHRDLKPGNVMVGSFGEVQVMDWGLAKVLGKEEGGGTKDEQRPATDSPSSFIPHPSSFPPTRPGSVLGTPAYTAPEQAAGEGERLDERSDVFGLGAILCEILTGQPPYVGKDPVQVHRKAIGADLADARARLEGCGADAELLGLALACLAPQAADRPRDAQAVADALTAYLDGVQTRLRQAELAQAEARARAAEEAKRRRLALALAGTVLLAVALGGGTALWLQADRQARQAQLTREVNDALNQVTALREQAKTATAGSAALFAQARGQAQRAQALVQTGPADEALKDQVRSVQAELDEEEKDRQLIADLDDARLAQAETLSRLSRFATERAVPLFRRAFRAYGLPAGEGEPSAAAARLRQRPRQVREAVSAALDEWIFQATKPQRPVREPHLDWLRALAVAGPDEGGMREVRAASQERDPGKRRAALEELARAADVSKLPPHTLQRLAKHLLLAQSPSSAIQLLRRARQQYPDDFWVNQDLGVWLAMTEPLRWAEAVRYLTAAVALRPNSPGVHNNLGSTLQKGGQLDEAIACFQKALALDPKYVMAHVNLGFALYARGEVEKAIACYRQALALDPKDANIHGNLGAALEARGKEKEAMACYHKGVEMDPRSALAHYNLGTALKARGKEEEAIAAYRKAIALDPKFANPHYNLGAALLGKGQVEEAIACYRKAIAADPRFAQAHTNLGAALEARGRLDEAVTCYRKAIDLDPKDANPHYNLGNALSAQGEVVGAIACYRTAIALDPKYAQAHTNLGTALKARGRLDEAIACYRQAVEIDPRLPEAQVNLAAALAAQGKPGEAISHYRKAAQLLPGDASVHYDLGTTLLNLGAALAAQGKRSEAISHYCNAVPCFRKAIELEPAKAEAHCNLGHALLGGGDFTEALAPFQRGHELGGKRGDWKYPSDQWVRDCEQLIEREKRLLDVLAGKSAPADARERLEWAGLCLWTRRYAAAVRLLGEAFGAEAKLADDLKAGHRYQAATAAALAAAGKGRDAGGLADAQKADLRKRALGWLKAELAARAKQPAGERAAALRRWQTDAALAGVRGEKALRALPGEERASWGAFWSEVQKHLRDAGGH
jgi:serine/threonine-protein kinase